MPPPRIPLLDRIRDGTFRPDRHKELVRDEDLPARPPSGFPESDWRQLRDLQVELREARSDRERTRVAYAISDVAKRAREAADAGSITLELAMEVACGPNYDRFGSDDARLGAWHVFGKWVVRHRLAWALQHDVLEQMVLCELEERYGKGEKKLAAIARRRDELEAAFWADYEGDRGAIPDPPNVYAMDEAELAAIGRRIRPEYNRALKKERASFQR